MILNEEKRAQLLGQSKRADKEKDGKNRYEKRVKSKVKANVSNLNKINFNQLFKENIVTVSLDVQGETDDYIVTISFGGFLDELKKQLKQNNNELSLRIIIRALLNTFNSDNVYIRCSCLSKNTKIKLLDGTSPTVEEMKIRFDSGEKLYVYSVDENGDFKPGEVEKVWITNQCNTNLIRVTLDNGEFIETTPDHLYMLRDGSYIQACNLKIGQSLMSLYFKDFIEDLKLDKRYNHKIVAIDYIATEPQPVYDIKVKNYHNFLVDSGVILHNCDDFKYRHAFWLSKNNIITGEKETRPSNKTNPNNSLGRGCKHIMLVISNTSWIIKLGSVIHNYYNYMQQHYKKMWADIIYPAIWDKKYEEPIQLDIDTLDKDELDTDTVTVDASNIEARDRGKFKKGNTLGVKFKPKEDKNRNRSLLDLEDEEE